MNATLARVLANRKLVVVIVVVIVVILIMLITTIGPGGEAQKTPTVASNPNGTATAARAATVAAGDTTNVPPPPTGAPIAPPTGTSAPVIVRVGFATATATPTATPTTKASPVGRGTVTATVTPTVAAIVIGDFPPIPTDDDQSLIAITGVTSELDWEGIGFVWGRTCLKGCIKRSEAREFPAGTRVLVPNMNLEVVSGTLRYEGVSFSGSVVIPDKLDHNWVKVTDLTLEPTGPKNEVIPTSQVITTLGKMDLVIGGGRQLKMLTITSVLVEKTGEVVRLTLKDAWWILLPDGEAKDKILGTINQLPPPELTPTPTQTRVVTATKTKTPPTPTRTATRKP